MGYHQTWRIHWVLRWKSHQKLGSHDFHQQKCWFSGEFMGLKLMGMTMQHAWIPARFFVDLRDAGFWSIQTGISQANKGDLTYIYNIYICKQMGLYGISQLLVEMGYAINRHRHVRNRRLRFHLWETELYQFDLEKNTWLILRIHSFRRESTNSRWHLKSWRQFHEIIRREFEGFAGQAAWRPRRSWMYCALPSWNIPSATRLELVRHG